MCREFIEGYEDYCGACGRRWEYCICFCSVCPFDGDCENEECRNTQRCEEIKSIELRDKSLKNDNGKKLFCFFDGRSGRLFGVARFFGFWKFLCFRANGSFFWRCVLKFILFFVELENFLPAFLCFYPVGVRAVVGFRRFTFYP